MLKPLILVTVVLFSYSFKAMAISAEEYLHAVEKMYDLNLPESFIELADINFNEDDRDAILKLNILSFIKPVNWQMFAATPVTIEKCKNYMDLHRKTLSAVESKYKVPKEVVTALTWIETRLGTYLGNRNVIHVYFSLMQADHPQAVAALIAMAKQMLNTPTLDPAVEAKIRERAVTKSKWASEQMMALYKMHKHQMFDLNLLYGSFAGAFGLVQFIPSSYISWAVAINPNQHPNLFVFDDAAPSVGNYLKIHGWRPEDPQSHIDALFAYNHSMSYVNSILELAEQLK